MFIPPGFEINKESAAEAVKIPLRSLSSVLKEASTTTAEPSTTQVFESFLTHPVKCLATVIFEKLQIMAG